MKPPTALPPGLHGLASCWACEEVIVHGGFGEFGPDGTQLEIEGRAERFAVKYLLKRYSSNQDMARSFMPPIHVCSLQNIDRHMVERRKDGPKG